MKRDSRRQVRLDEAGDDINGWFLRRQDQVNSDGATFLSDANDVLLNVLARRHHQICHLIGDDDNERHIERNRGFLFFGLRIEPLNQLFVA